MCIQGGLYKEIGLGYHVLSILVVLHKNNSYFTKKDVFNTFFIFKYCFFNMFV